MWCTAEKRYVPHVCLRNPFPLFLVGIPSIHSLPETWASWEPPTFRHLCIKSWLHHGHPFVAAAEKTCLVQRSRPRFVTIQCLCSQLCYVNAGNQWTIVEIEILATVSWTCGCQPFSCRCSQNVMHCRKEICSTCLFKESIPTIHLWNSKHPTCQKLEVPESRSTFRHLCIKWWHHAHPFVAAPEKDRVMQRSRGFGHEVVSKEVLQVNNCRDWDFSNGGLEAGLPAFQLPMFAKCDALPKRDMFHMFV